MKTTRAIAILALAACLGLLVPGKTAVAQQSAGELFEKALYVEEGQGDLQKAIGLYQDIVKRFAGQRETAAKALLHIGICYEKLGKTEARSAYNQLLRDYADQLQLAKEASSRLAQLQAAGGAPAGSQGSLTFRKLDIPDAGHSHQARLSPDGSKFLYVGFQDKEPYYLRVLDLASGRSRTLVEGMDANTASLIFAWSPDGKKAVYRAGRGELRVVDVGSGESELLWASPVKDTSVLPLDWSGQNQSMLIRLTNSAENMVRLAVLPETGGIPRTVVSGSTDDLGYGIGQFSPDGTLVVGDMRKDKNVDIYVWKVEGGEEIRITDHQGEDTYPLWSPDGKYIVFMSDRAKTYDLWAVPMNGPRPAGEPRRLQANIGRNKIPSGLTQSGVLTFYAMSSAGTPSDLFFLPVDQKTGEAGGDFHPFAAYPTKGQRWSPDSTRIAYTSRRGNFQLPNAYVTAGGDSAELEIPARNHWMNDIEWSRDGKSLIFPGWNNDDALVGIFRISLDDQEIRPIHKPGQRYESNFGGAYVNLRWLPLAGRYIFFRLLGDGKEEVFLMDPQDYKIERIAEKGGMGGYSFPSPDGRYLIAPNFLGKTIDLMPVTEGAAKALMAFPSGGIPLISWAPDGKSFIYTEDRRLKIYSVPDGPARILVEAGPGKTLPRGGLLSGAPNTAFSPDGTMIAYALQDAGEGPGRRSELWIVDAAGRSPRKIADAPASHPLLGEVVWDPSGKTIFAEAQTAESRRTYEHWVMENFLPAAPAPAAEAGQSEYRVTRIPTDPAVANVSFISPDGEKLALAGVYGDIWVRDIAAGKDKQLTKTPDFEYWCFWSPDSQRIAYIDHRGVISIISVDGGEPVTLVKPDSEFLKSVEFVWPTGWTPDGNAIICHLSGRGLCAVPINGGAWRDVFPIPTQSNDKDFPLMVPSPDNRWVAYSLPTSGNGDIFLSPAAGGERIRVTDHPSSEDMPTWSWDGRYLAFISGRSGEKEIWAVRISPEGRPEGEPIQVSKSGTGRNAQFGWTRKGSIGISRSPIVQNLFLNDRATEKESQLTRMLTNDQRPRWSPDGTRIAYLSENAGKWDIWVVKAEGGEPRLVTGSFTGRAGIELIRGPAWLPDGKSLAFIVFAGADDKRGIWVIPAEGGEPRKVDFSYEGSILNMDWSPDGKAIAFEYNGRVADKSIKGSRIYEGDIYVIPVGGGEPRRITQIDKTGFGFIRPRWSPDGKKIAFLSDDWSESAELNTSRQIWVADIETGKTEQISAGLNQVWMGVGWAADGKSIYYSARINNKDRVFSIPIQGGEPENLGIEGTFAESSPEGTRLVYSRLLTLDNETWLIENFLPPGKK